MTTKAAQSSAHKTIPRIEFPNHCDHCGELDCPGHFDAPPDHFYFSDAAESSGDKA